MNVVGIRRYYTALTGADRLVRRKGETSSVAKRPKKSAAIFRPKSFGGITDDFQAFLLCKRLQRVVIGASPIYVDRHNRAGARSHGTCGFLHIDREAAGF